MESKCRKQIFGNDMFQNDAVISDVFRYVTETISKSGDENVKSIFEEQSSRTLQNRHRSLLNAATTKAHEPKTNF